MVYNKQRLLHWSQLSDLYPYTQGNQNYEAELIDDNMIETILAKKISVA